MSHHPLHFPVLSISSILLISLSIFSIPAGAATFTVTNLNDSGPGSLRQAILDANSVSGAASTVQFQTGLTGTITIASPYNITAGSLTINGPGASQLAISGNFKTRIFYIDSASGFSIVAINNLTLRDGYNYVSAADATCGTGGAIYNVDTELTLNNCILHYNYANYGGAIFNGDAGTLLVNNSTLYSNMAFTKDDNTCGWGGALYNDDGSLTVNNSTLSDNWADEGGGGILSHGTMEVNNSTLSDNWASEGGGINSNSTTAAKVNNSTLSGNNSDYSGGGIINWGSLVLTNNTLSNNTSGRGGGIRNRGKVTLSNTIVAGNTASVEGKEVSSIGSYLFISQGHNLFGENGADGLLNAPRAASDLVLAGPITTAIGPLTNNGGPTQTHLPVIGSPAINGGDGAVALAGGITDQRGAGFPRIVNDHADIGAVEVQPPGSLVAGLTSSGQIYFTAVTPPPGAIGGLRPSDASNINVTSANFSTWGTLPGQLTRLSVGDFNGDGEGDLVGIANNGSIWYTTERGAWTQAPGGLSQIRVGDFTGAGQDGLAGLAANGTIWYSTTLTGWTQVPGQLSQLVTGDFNGDGKADLAGIAANGTIWYSTTLTSWSQAPGALAQLQVGDLNGDGKDDLAGIAANGTIWYSTDLATWNQAPGALAQLQVGDLNGDGQADLAGIAANGTIWYSTTLTGWTQLPGALSQLVVSDLNGDGQADLAGIASNGTIWYSTTLTGWDNLPGQLAQLAGR